MAPDASVAYYGAASCYDDDMMATLARVVTDNKASVVSNSWGEPTYVVIGGVTYTTIDQALVDAYEAIFQQGAVQGIGFFFSSGDNGDEVANTGVKSPDFPAADPWVTAVGGTSLASTEPVGSSSKPGGEPRCTAWLAASGRPSVSCTALAVVAVTSSSSPPTRWP